MKNNLFAGALTMYILFHAFNALAQNSYKAPEPVSRIKNHIEICVHPQVELISIIQTIGNYPSIFGFLMSKDSSGYKNDVFTYFSKYNEHQAVKMFDRLSSQPRMLNFSAPSNIMLYTDNNLCLRKDAELDTFVLNRSGGVDSLAVFLDLLRDFANQSSFNKFYEEHRNFYMEMVNTTAGNLGDRDYILELETFYGRKQKSYSIILVSLYNGVGFGNSLLFEDGTRELYNTMGSFKVENDVPFFGDASYLKYMIRHEFSHPFINPVTEKKWSYIEPWSSGYDLIPEIARKQVCGDWQECINEFVIRAVTTHLAKCESYETGKWAYEKEKSRGVIWLDDLLGKILVYQANREIYPTFESYYFEILDTFKD
jgi:hypothetical protein